MNVPAGADIPLGERSLILRRAARDKAPEEGFWSDVGDATQDLGGGLANAAGTVVNGVASFGNALLNHPEMAGGLALGGVTAAASAPLAAGGVAVSGTGVGWA